MTSSQQLFSSLTDAIRANKSRAVQKLLFQELSKPSLYEDETFRVLSPAIRFLIRQTSITEVLASMRPAIAQVLQNDIRPAMSAVLPAPLEGLFVHMPTDISRQEDLDLVVFIVNLCKPAVRSFSAIRMKASVQVLFTDVTTETFIHALHAGFPTDFLPDLSWVLDSYFCHTTSEKSFEPATRIFRAMRHKGIKFDINSTTWDSPVLLKAFLRAVPSVSSDDIRASIYAESMSPSEAYFRCRDLGLQTATPLRTASQHLEYLASSTAVEDEFFRLASLSELSSSERAQVLRSAYLKFSFSDVSSEAVRQHSACIENIPDPASNFVHSLLLPREYAISHLDQIRSFTDAQLNQISFLLTAQAKHLRENPRTTTFYPEIVFGLFLREASFLSRLRREGYQYAATAEHFTLLSTLQKLADILRPAFKDPRQLLLHSLHKNFALQTNTEQPPLLLYDKLLSLFIQHQVPFAQLQPFCHASSPILLNTKPDRAKFQDIIDLQAANATPSQIQRIIETPSLLLACRKVVLSSVTEVESLIRASSVLTPKLL